MKTYKINTYFIVLAFLIMPITMIAQAPQLINYQGSLQENGAPLTGEVNIIFSIFDAETEGNSLWTESQSGVNVTQGIFQVLLGSVTSFPADLFNNDGERFLEVSVDGTALTPRSKFTSVAYALTAQMAEEVKPGEVVKSINNIEDDITLTAGSNVSITSAGNEITISSTAGGTGGGDITAVASGEGLTGGGETGDVTIGLDIPFTDGKYVNIGEVNSITGEMIQAGEVVTSINDHIALDAVSANQINDEPGLTFEAPGGLINLVSTEHTDLVTVTISVPKAGYIFLSGRAMVKLSGTTLANGVIMQIDEFAGGDNIVGIYSFIQLGSFPTASLFFYDCSAQRTYTVDTPGEYTFRLEAKQNGINGSAAIYYPFLTAQYFPTAYGNVAVSSSVSSATTSSSNIDPSTP